MSMVNPAGLQPCARRAWRPVLSSLVAAGLLAAPCAAQAQRPASKAAASSTAQRGTPRAVDVRWYPWVGCWQRTTDIGPAGVLTCIVPAEGASAVDLLTVANGSVESRERLTVDGRPHSIEKDGCTGSQTATWATTGARVYIGSAYTCAGDLHGRSSTLYAILPTGEWIDVHQIESGGGRVLAVTRYRDAGLPSALPAAIRGELSRHTLAATTARASAGASTSQTEVAEAQRAVDPVVVQAWLTARAQGYATNTGPAPATTPSTVGEVRVYEGSPPAAMPGLERVPATRVPICDSSGCYVENPYSDYNGISYIPYSPYPTMYTGSYYPYPYVAPIVVIRGGSRFDGHRPFDGRPPVFHMPLGHQPTGPSGIHPVQPQQPQQPRGGVPGRIRP